MLYNSPYLVKPASVRSVMLRVAAALVPGIAAYLWFFGAAVLVQIALASFAALAGEALVLALRGGLPRWPSADERRWRRVCRRAAKAGFPRALAEVARRDGDPRALGLSAGHFGGEPWTEEMRAQIERELGVNVMTSQQAILWNALRTAGINDRIEGYGRLLREF